MNKQAKKPKKVTQKFLLKLADDIYNPKTKRFLRLCDGTLENGPDPTDQERAMHCGLGELYFAITGRQPATQDGVTEQAVVDLAFDLSPLGDEKVKFVKAAWKAGFAVRDGLTDVDGNDIEGAAVFVSKKETAFKDTVDSIQNVNDDGCGNSCSDETFKSRSKRVADALRKAAKLLPA